MTDGQRFFVGAKDTVTAARFATFMLKQMGYTVADYKASVAKLAETKGSNVDATVTGDLTRDAAVGVMYGALTAEKASGKTVIADIIGDDADLKAKAEKLGLLVPPAAVSELAVESVKALNCKQIQVVFNQEMDRDSVETEEFYEIYNNGSSNKVELGESSASLDSDKKTVTITLNKNVADKLTNSSEAKVILKKDIKAKSDMRLAKDVTFDKVEVQDGLIPTVSKVEATGQKMIRITFSEPVYDKGNDNSIATANFKVVSGTYQYFVQEATLNNNVIDLVVGTNLIEGPVSVTVNEAGADKDDCIRDYAGYAVFKGTTKFDYVRDTSVSVVTVKSASKDKVVLGFSKPVKGTDVKLYHSARNSIYVSKVTTTGYVDEITFTYGKDVQLPHGTVKLILVNSDDDKNKLVDGYGIKVPDQPLTCEIVIDETAPVFTYGSFNKDVSITLTFDEELDKKVALDTDNYKIKKVKDNTDIAFSIEIDDTTINGRRKVTLLPDPKLDDNTEYQVFIKRARDIYGNITTKEYTYTFTTGDNNAPVVMDPQCSAKAHDGKITIVYSEPMNESQMLDKANYMVSIGEGIKYKNLGDNDSLTKVNDRTVTIYIKELDNKDDPTINIYVKIAPIMDLAGKRLYDRVDPHVVKLFGADTTVFVTVKSAKENRVVLGFSKPVKGSNIKLYYDLYYMINTATATTTDYTDEITFIFSSSLPYYINVLNLVNSTTESERLIDRNGVYVPDQRLVFDVEAPPAPPAPPAPSDTTAPSVVGQPVVNSSTSITITFNENLNSATANALASYTIKKLPDDTQVTFTAQFDGSRTVVLTPSSPLEDNTDYKLTVKCKDLYGNMNSTPYEFNIIPPVYNVDIMQAQLIAKDRIKVVFNKRMTTININDFLLTTSQGGEIYVNDYAPDTDDPDGKTIFLTPEENLATDATMGGFPINLTTVDVPTSSSERNIALRQPESPLEVADKVVPEIVSVVIGGDISNFYNHETQTIAHGAAVTITVLFSEAVANIESENILDIFNVDGFSVTSIEPDVVNDKIIIIKATANDDPTNMLTTLTISDGNAQYVCDLAGNAIVGSSWQAALDENIAN